MSGWDVPSGTNERRVLQVGTVFCSSLVPIINYRISLHKPTWLRMVVIHTE